MLYAIDFAEELGMMRDGKAERRRVASGEVDHGQCGSALTIAALRAHLAQQAIHRRAWGDAYEEGGLAFCREDGSHQDPTMVGRRFARAVSETKLTRLRFHDLRHTSAVIGLRELGEWPDETSARLGHSSVAFTLETNGHLLPKRGKAVAVAFDRLLDEAAGAA